MNKIIKIVDDISYKSDELLSLISKEKKDFDLVKIKNGDGTSIMEDIENLFILSDKISKKLKESKNDTL